MDKKTNMSMDAEIGMKERLSYTLGGGGINISMALLGFLLTYYTMVLGISAGTAAMVIAVSKIFDGVSDLVMGYIVDHTKSANGKARPWLIRMVIPTAIASIAAFMVPMEWNTTAKIVYMFLTYNLANTICYTAIAVAFNTLNGYMTTNQRARGMNGGFVMIMNALTNTVVNAAYLQLARLFGGGNVYSARGWTLMMVLFAAVYSVMILICYFGTTERASNIKSEEHKADVGIGRSIKALVTNRYWWICIITMLIVFTLSALTASSMVYFAQFVLGNVDLQAVLSIAMSLAMIPAAIASTFLMGKTGKRNMMIIGLGIFAIASLLPLLQMSAPLCSISMALKGIGLGLGAAPCSSLVLDALTYGEWKNGFSTMGLGNAANSFSMKMGTSFGTIVLGVLLEMSGFISGADVQPGSAVTMIENIFVWVPFVFAAISVAVLAFYNLDKTYPAIEADLKAGKYASDRVKAE